MEIGMVVVVLIGIGVLQLANVIGRQKKIREEVEDISELVENIDAKMDRIEAKIERICVALKIDFSDIDDMDFSDR